MKGFVCQADIIETDKELQAKNLYGSEESDVARVCLALVSVGVKKRTVNILAQPITKEKFDLYWQNLEKNGYFDNGKGKAVTLESLEENDVPFILMMKCAQGQIERAKEEA